MQLIDLIKSKQPVLSEGSVYELLRRYPGVCFDEYIAHGGLIYDEKSTEVLERVFREYFQVAEDYAMPMVTTTATWRCNQSRIKQSVFSECSVNEDNVKFLADIRRSYSIPIILGGNIGPKGDAYKPEQALESVEASRFHTV